MAIVTGTMLTVDGKAMPDPTAMKYGLQDVSGSNAGRTTNTIMHKNRKGQKVTLALSWNNKPPDVVSYILKAFNPEYIKVKYHDPLKNEKVVKEFYVGDRTAQIYRWTNHYKRYQVLSFNIIER